MIRNTITFLAVTALTAPTASAQHERDLWIGKSAGRVMWSSGGLVPGSLYHPLQRVDTFLHGWSANNPGFDRVTSTLGEVSPLTASSQIWLKVVAIDPGLVVIDNAFNVLEFAGDMTHLGSGTDLHVHVTWFVDENDPEFVSDKCVWEGVFQFVDSNGGLAPSPVFVLLFSNVPVRGGEFPPILIAATGDFNEDRDVDGYDFMAFAECMSGPDVRPAPDDSSITLCEVLCYNALDFDDDMDIDILDFAEFQVVYRP